MATNITSSTSSCSFISSNQRVFTHNNNKYPILTSFCPSNLNHSSFNSCKLNANHKFSIQAMGSSDESHGKGTPDTKKSSSGWKKWAVGLAFSILIPSFGHKLSPLLILKSKLDNVLETVETVSEVVEELAEETEKLAEELDKRLPQDAKLKEASQLVEKLAIAVNKEAELTQQLIHKVEEVENEVEELIEAEAAQKKSFGKKK
ncbi:hypothetical protein LguiB_018656 [Lonicera macranthoides]